MILTAGHLRHKLLMLQKLVIRGLREEGGLFPEDAIFPETALAYSDSLYPLLITCSFHHFRD
jgi:hypothetical protein